MESKILQINNKEVSYQSILNQDYSFEPNPFEIQVFSLVSSWLSGNGDLEIKTSGSTGTPKVHSFSRDQIKASIYSTKKLFQLKKGMNSFICLGPQYVAGMMMILRSLEIGMNMIIVEPSSNPLSDQKIESNLHFAAFVPLQIRTMLQSEKSWSILKDINVVIVGGGEVSDLPGLEDLNGRVYGTFGMTETLTHIALRQLTGPERSEYFRAIPEVELSMDERQCLKIKYDALNLNLTTNDVIEFGRNKTEFRWLGRADFVINSGGVKIFPEQLEKEIDQILREGDLSVNFFITGESDGHLGEKVVMVLEATPESGFQKIKNLLKSKLHPYSVPKSIRSLDAFIYSPTGKLRRSETAALLPSE